LAQKEFDFSFTPLESALVRKFKTLLALERKDTFSSDDFRMYGLDRHIEDTQHGIGGFFARLVHAKKIREVGQTRSLLPQNNLRKIKVYTWNDKR
jgi:hypothetical protein